MNTKHRVTVTIEMEVECSKKDLKEVVNRKANSIFYKPIITEAIGDKMIAFVKDEKFNHISHRWMSF